MFQFSIDLHAESIYVFIDHEMPCLSLEDEGNTYFANDTSFRFSGLARKLFQTFVEHIVRYDNRPFFGSYVAGRRSGIPHSGMERTEARCA